MILKKSVYMKKRKKYKVVKEIKDFRINATSMDAFRDSLAELESKLGGCKVIVGSQITGIPFYFFDKKGYKVCESEEFSKKLLDQIYEDFLEISVYEIKDEVNKIEIKNIPIKPVELDEEGNYFLDFVKVQKYRPEISSKRALIPFFNNEIFSSLTIICSHIMPWLDIFLKERDLEVMLFVEMVNT